MHQKSAIKNLKSKSQRKMQNEYWFEVLNYFEKQRYIANGLTIPFLIGSRKIIEPKNNVQKISEFLSEMFVSPNLTTIMKCSNIKEYVIGILDLETKLIINKEYNGKKVFKYFGNLIAMDNSCDNIENENSLIVYLESLYGKTINEEKFSLERGTWTNFSAEDKKRLTQLSITLN
ncbi:MAG: hypothetical protein ACK5P4_08285 [Bacteroidota bacterium]|jgi:hypothetical protein